ncbi:MAG: response regulator [Vicinamibacterales bacterium]|nr:response regulator [Vicinamibacterales bacterium]
MRILVVDDNAEFLRAARFLLKQLGHEPVGLARSGDEGLALAAGLNPDVVLMDLGLPDVDGVETARRMKIQSGSVPVIAIAGRNDMAFRHRSAEAGCDAFIPKADLADDLPRVLVRLAAKVGLTTERVHV